MGRGARPGCSRARGERGAALAASRGVDPLELRHAGRRVRPESDGPAHRARLARVAAEQPRRAGVGVSMALSAVGSPVCGSNHATCPPMAGSATSSGSAVGVQPGVVTTFHSPSRSSEAPGYRDVIRSWAKRAGTGSGSTNAWSVSAPESSPPEHALVGRAVLGEEQLELPHRAGHATQPGRGVEDRAGHRDGFVPGKVHRQRLRWRHGEDHAAAESDDAIMEQPFRDRVDRDERHGAQPVAAASRPPSSASGTPHQRNGSTSGAPARGVTSAWTVACPRPRHWHERWIGRACRPRPVPAPRSTPGPRSTLPAPRRPRSNQIFDRPVGIARDGVEPQVERRIAIVGDRESSRARVDRRPRRRPLPMPRGRVRAAPGSSASPGPSSATRPVVPGSTSNAYGPLASIPMATLAPAGNDGDRNVRPSASTTKGVCSRPSSRVSESIVPSARMESSPAAGSASSRYQSASSPTSVVPVTRRLDGIGTAVAASSFGPWSVASSKGSRRCRAADSAPRPPARAPRRRGRRPAARRPSQPALRARPTSGTRGAAPRRRTGTPETSPPAAGRA